MNQILATVARCHSNVGPDDVNSENEELGENINNQELESEDDLNDILSSTSKRKAPQEPLHSETNNATKRSKKIHKLPRGGKQSETALLGAELEVMHNFNKVLKNKVNKSN